MKSKNLKITIANIFTILFIVVFPHLELISFFSMLYTIPVILLVWLCLKVNNETFKSIGFNLNSIGLKPLLIGSISAILILLFMRTVFFPVLEYFIRFKEVDVDLYNDLRSNSTTYYVLIVILGWIVGGLYESIVFHAFTFTQLEKLIGGKYKTLISFMITSILFGLYHYQLGTADTINALIVGTGYLGLFLFYKRNLWYTIFCHGAYNTIVITLIHLSYI